MKNERYWVVVVSKDHALRGTAGGFMQACHGKQAPLKRMKPGDWVLFYSSKTTILGEEKCQAFTAIGQVADGLIYPFKMTEDFEPFRRNVRFFETRETSILPLIPKLEFIPNKSRWGYPFRFGILEINEHDFNIVSTQMLAHELAK